jgi:glycolate oxidase iron-sulfur subunit
MKEYGDLVEGTELPAEDLMVFLDREGLTTELGALSSDAETVVAYHDACHALRAQRIREEPRRVLGRIPGLRVVDIVDGDRCCGAAGLYQVTEPAMSGQLMRQKAERIRDTGARIVASANPGCTIQIAAGARELGIDLEVRHPVELLDRAMSGPSGR